MRATIFLFITCALIFNSCKRGCKDSNACNYEKKAIRKGTCSYEPAEMKTASLKLGSINTKFYSLDLSTGAITEGGNAVEGCLLYNVSNPWPILTVGGGEGVKDVGTVGGVCEIKSTSGPFGTPSVSAAGHGYVVHVNATNKYARVFLESIQGETINLKWEYPFE